MKSLIASALFILCISNSFAQATYNSEKNIVELRTPLPGSSDTGSIKIYNEKRVEIMGLGLNKSKDKMIAMCGNNPSLGLLFLNSKLNFGAKVPKVTDIPKPTNTSDSTKEEIAAGWVHSYVLKGDDAQDLMDLLLDNKAVGFAFKSDATCKETKFHAQGRIIINFETNGLERAMKRIK